MGSENVAVIADVLNRLELGDITPRQAEHKIAAVRLSPPERCELGQGIMSIANRGATRRSPYDQLMRLYRLAYALDASAEPSASLRSRLGAANVRPPVQTQTVRRKHALTRTVRVAVHLGISERAAEVLLAEVFKLAEKEFQTMTIVAATPRQQPVDAAVLLQRIKKREENKQQRGWKPPRLQTYTIGENRAQAEAFRTEGRRRHGRRKRP